MGRVRGREKEWDDESEHESEGGQGEGVRRFATPTHVCLLCGATRSWFFSCSFMPSPMMAMICSSARISNRIVLISCSRREEEREEEGY